MDDEKSHDKQAALAAFGTAVRTLRIERGFSQEAFADECGLDRTYIGGVERGERNIGLVNVYRIVEALDIEASLLFQTIEASRT